MCEGDAIKAFLSWDTPGNFSVSINTIDAIKMLWLLHNWKPTGPTVEDIRAATKAENPAAKGSQEDKLISAVKNGDLQNVKTFISAGAGLEARDNENMTALMRAAEKGLTSSKFS